MNTKIKYLFLFVLLVSILAACGAPAPTVAPANPTEVPATEPTAGNAASSNFPTGKFIKSGTINYGFIFNEDGTYSRFEGNVTATRGTYSVDGNVFTETSNDGGCASNISHMFTFDGKNLTFNYVGNPQDDTCGGGGRRADFDNVTYTLSKEANFPSGKFIKAGTTNYGLLFNADGTFSAFDGNRTFIQATYTVEGNVFTETSNSGGCKTNESFTYIFDGTNLTFNYVGNPDDDTACDGRRADFNNVTYTLTSVPHAAAVITQNFWDAILANDIDTAMGSVADDVVTSGGPQSFTDRVKFGAFMISKMELGITYEISDLRVVSEDTVTYDMKVYENGKLIASGLTTLQVADGKIIKIKLP